MSVPASVLQAQTPQSYAMSGQSPPIADSNRIVGGHWQYRPHSYRRYCSQQKRPRICCCDDLSHIPHYHHHCDPKWVAAAVTFSKGTGHTITAITTTQHSLC
eukprot:Lankesteria_metandrocarpae@DN10751_c0_g1_i1.p1